MELKILGTMLVLEFSINIIASLVEKGARNAFHRKVAGICACVVILSALAFFLTLVIFLISLIWR